VERRHPDITRPRRWQRDPTITGGRQDGPRVLILRLSERTSSRGNVYLSGYFGAARLIGFKAAENDRFGNEQWEIYAVEPAPRATGGDQP
jgi:hypothetical protein